MRNYLRSKISSKTTFKNKTIYKFPTEHFESQHPNNGLMFRVYPHCDKIYPFKLEATSLY